MGREKFAAAGEEQVRDIAEAPRHGRVPVTQDRAEGPGPAAAPPFTTSTLQQQASLRLHFAASRTMKTAQRLYEGVELAARAQSPSSPTCVPTARASRTTRCRRCAATSSSRSATRICRRSRTYASGKSAQEAHEAIRPTDVAYTPERAAQLGLHATSCGCTR